MSPGEDVVGARFDLSVDDGHHRAVLSRDVDDRRHVGAPRLFRHRWQPSGDPVAPAATVYAARVELGFDAGALVVGPPYPAQSIQVPTSQFMRNLGDVGVRQGEFDVFGTAAAPDGGLQGPLWVWRIREDGQAVDGGLTTFELASGVSAVAAGPELDDGSLLFAYSRAQADWSWPQRVYTRTLGDALAVGAACEFDTDCTTRFCVSAVCCINATSCLPGDAGVGQGLAVYQVGCRCDSVTGGFGLWAVALAWLLLPRKAVRRRFSVE